MKKKLLSVILVVIVIISLILIILQSNSDSKEKIIRYVMKNQQALSSEVEQMLPGSTEDAKKTYEEYDVYSWHEKDLVEFILKKKGLGGSSTYKGFYYSLADQPIGFQGNEVSFLADGNGWIWKDTMGDNWEYTERISECWYYFEIHF